LASWLLGLCVLWVAGGASCHQTRRLDQVAALPTVLPATPQLDEVIAAINRNDSIQKMQSTSTTIEVLDTNLPRLKASLAMERPNHLRLRASVPFLMGSGLDVGSNDQLFWMRYPEGMQQTLLFANHAEYEQNMMTAPLPVNPKWLIEALGLVHLDRQLVTEGPIQRDDGTLEVRSDIPTASGTYRRILLIDGQAGFIREQIIYDPRGQLVANSRSADHRLYEELGVVLPHSVRIQLQSNIAPPFALQVEVGDYVLNQLLVDDPRLFEMPTDGSQQMIDLSRPAAMVPPAGLPPAALPPTGYVPTASQAPPLRR